MSTRGNTECETPAFGLIARGFNLDYLTGTGQAEVAGSQGFHTNYHSRESICSMSSEHAVTEMNQAGGESKFAHSPTSPAWGRREVALALGCMLVGLVLRWQAARHPLSVDEIWMLSGAAGRGKECTAWKPGKLRISPRDTTALERAAPPINAWTRGVLYHPPLHMFTLWWWRALAGGSDWMAAMYSTVWSVVAIGFAFAAIRLQSGAGPATCVALTMALSSVLTTIGTEVRGYGMLMGLTACVAWQMTRIECLGATRRRVWLLGLSMCPLMLLHYFAAATCLAVCGWAWFRLTGPFRRQFPVSVVTAALLYCAVWMPIALEHLRLTQTVNPTRTDVPFLQGAGPAALALPARLLFVLRESQKQGSPEILAAVGIGAILVLVGMRRDPGVLKWVLLLVLPIAAMMVLDASRETAHSFRIRSSAAAAIGAAAAPVLAAFAIRRSWGWIVGIGFVALAALGVGAPRDITWSGPYYTHMQEALLPILNEKPRRIPLVSLRTPDEDHYLAMARMMQWAHVPGFFPRPAMVLDAFDVVAQSVAEVPPDLLRELARFTPRHRIWLLTDGKSSEVMEKQTLIGRLFPNVRVVQPPVLVPQRSLAEGPVALWLLELDVASEKSAEETPPLPPEE